MNNSWSFVFLKKKVVHVLCVVFPLKKCSCIKDNKDNKDNSNDSQIKIYE